MNEFEDIIAFEVEKMPGIRLDFVIQKLAVNRKKRPKPVRQKRRNHGEERSHVAAAKVKKKKLLDARFIRQCSYPDWVAYVVLVKTSNETWRMCVDYTQACPKDSYLLPKIDSLVDSTATHSMMSFRMPIESCRKKIKKRRH